MLNKLLSMLSPKQTGPVSEGQLHRDRCTNSPAWPGFLIIKLAVQGYRLVPEYTLADKQGSFLTVTATFEAPEE